MNALEKLRAAPPEVRAVALSMLDELSGPMSPRELDRAFADAGMSRAQARRATSALKHLNIIAVAPCPTP